MKTRRIEVIKPINDGKTAIKIDLVAIEIMRVLVFTESDLVLAKISLRSASNQNQFWKNYF